MRAVKAAPAVVPEVKAEQAAQAVLEVLAAQQPVRAAVPGAAKALELARAAKAAKGKARPVKEPAQAVKEAVKAPQPAQVKAAEAEKPAEDSENRAHTVFQGRGSADRSQECLRQLKNGPPQNPTGLNFSET